MSILTLLLAELLKRHGSLAQVVAQSFLFFLGTLAATLLFRPVHRHLALSVQLQSDTGRAHLVAKKVTQLVWTTTPTDLLSPQTLCVTKHLQVHHFIQLIHWFAMRKNVVIFLHLQAHWCLTGSIVEECDKLFFALSPVWITWSVYLHTTLMLRVFTLNAPR